MGDVVRTERHRLPLALCSVLRTRLSLSWSKGQLRLCQGLLLVRFVFYKEGRSVPQVFHLYLFRQNGVSNRVTAHCAGG